MKTLSSIINSINNDVKAYIGLTIAMFSICGLAFAFQLSQLAAVLRIVVPVFFCAFRRLWQSDFGLSMRW